MSTPLWLPKLIKKIFPYRRTIARLSRFPIVEKLLHLTLFNGDDLIYLPKDRVVINQPVEQPGSVALPSTVVDTFIKNASYRWIMHRCICREGDDCQDYPHDIGCIFLGEAVLTINPKLGRLASVEEALEHAQKARDLGLVQLIGRDRIDNIWMGARPFGKLMTICHCCPCCCLFRVLPSLAPSIRKKISRIPGVEVWVSDDCTGCGRCVRQGCFVEALRMENGRAVISADCVGCGRCVEACPQHAIHLEVTDSSYVDNAIRHISTLVDVGSEVKP